MVMAINRVIKVGVEDWYRRLVDIEGYRGFPKL